MQRSRAPMPAPIRQQGTPRSCPRTKKRSRSQFSRERRESSFPPVLFVRFPCPLAMHLNVAFEVATCTLLLSIIYYSHHHFVSHAPHFLFENTYCIYHSISTVIQLLSFLSLPASPFAPFQKKKTIIRKNYQMLGAPGQPSIELAPLFQ